MFKYSAQKQVLYPISIPTLKDDGSGETEASTLKIRYQPLTRNEMRELLASESRNFKVDETSQRLVYSPDQVIRNFMQQEYMKAYDNMIISHVTGWEGVLCADTGKPIPFSREKLRTIMEEHAPFSAAVDKGLWEVSKAHRLLDS